MPKGAAESRRRCATRLLHLRALREGVEQKRDGPVPQDGEEVCKALSGDGRSLEVSRRRSNESAAAQRASGCCEETCCSFSRITSM